MNSNIFEYIRYFLVFSFIGWIFENLIGKTNHFCGDTLMNSLNLCLPVLTIYGFGSIVLLFIKKNIIKNNIIFFSIMSGIVLSILECIGGKLSFIINKSKRWDYNYLPLPLCDGYVALPVFLFWVICSAVFFKIYEKFKNKENKEESKKNN